MSTFNPQEFMVEPSESEFTQLRKDDLILLGKHLKLDVRSPMRKREVQKLVMEYLVVEKVFEQSALDAYNVTQQLSESAVDLNNIDKENSEQTEKDRQWQREQDEIAWQREREKREWEAQREREEREFRLREQEIELQKLQLNSQNNKPASD